MKHRKKKKKKKIPKIEKNTEIVNPANFINSSINKKSQNMQTDDSKQKTNKGRTIKLNEQKEEINEVNGIYKEEKSEREEEINEVNGIYKEEKSEKEEEINEVNGIYKEEKSEREEEINEVNGIYKKEKSEREEESKKDKTREKNEQEEKKEEKKEEKEIDKEYEIKEFPFGIKSLCLENLFSETPKCILNNKYTLTGIQTSSIGTNLFFKEPQTVEKDSDIDNANISYDHVFKKEMRNENIMTRGDFAIYEGHSTKIISFEIDY